MGRDDRVDEYRTRAYRYRALLEWAGKWTDGNEQATLQEGFAHTLEDTARAYPDLDLTQALHIEPRVTTSKRRSTPGSTTIGEGGRTPHGQREDVPRAAGHRRRWRQYSRRDADD